MIGAAIEDMAASGFTSHPLMVKIQKSQMINKLMGGVWVTPFTVGELDENFFEVIESIYEDFPQIEESRAKVEARAQRWRNKKK